MTNQLPSRLLGDLTARSDTVEGAQGACASLHATLVAIRLSITSRAKLAARALQTLQRAHPGPSTLHILLLWVMEAFTYAYRLDREHEGCNSRCKRAPPTAICTTSSRKPMGTFHKYSTEMLLRALKQD